MDTPIQPTRVAATDPAGPTGRLATWLAERNLNEVPAAIQERAKAIMLDGLACAIVGAQLPWSRLAVELVTRIEGTGDRSLIGWGRTTSAPGAALLNGTFIQGFELDDFHAGAPLHSASLVLPALLACGQGLGRVTGRQFLNAVVAGFEVGPRVGLALHGGQMLSRGWHSGAVFGTHAAAAAVGTLLGLNAAQFEDALGLAGTQSAGLMAAQYEAMSKRMHHGFSARNGMVAAMLAQGGFTGIKRVFEREYGGFLSTFGEGHAPDASQVCSELGERWETERIIIKPYAAMGGLLGPLAGLFEILANRPIAAEEIERVEVGLSHAVFHHGWWTLERPITPIAAQMNVGYALAVGILDGAALVAQFAPDRIDRDDVWALIPRITAYHHAEFDRGGPQARGRVRLRIQLRDGTCLENAQDTPKALLKQQESGEIACKFRALTEGLIAPEHQAEMERLVMRLEDLADITPLIDLLALPASAAFC